MRFSATTARRRFWVLVGASFALALAILLFVSACSTANAHNGKEDDLLETIREEIIPPAGTQTDYEVPLALASLPQFIDWSYEIRLSMNDQEVFHEALIELVAPCCDDNTMFKCCCEKEGRACNIVRSGKGLAAYLIREKGYDVEEVRAAVLQWLHFARPDYYLAQAINGRGMDPHRYDLTTVGSCYRQMCQVPISQGGCGGMEELIEPAIHEDKS